MIELEAKRGDNTEAADASPRQRRTESCFVASKRTATGMLWPASDRLPGQRKKRAIVIRVGACAGLNGAGYVSPFLCRSGSPPMMSGLFVICCLSVRILAYICSNGVALISGSVASRSSTPDFDYPDGFDTVAPRLVSIFRYWRLAVSVTPDRSLDMANSLSLPTACSKLHDAGSLNE